MSISNVMVAGQQAQRIMLGTGAESIKVWPTGVTPAMLGAPLWLRAVSSPTDNGGSWSGTASLTGSASYANYYFRQSIYSSGGYRQAWTGYPGDWSNGCTVSMWLRKEPDTTGYKTIMHRCAATSSITAEMYVSMYCDSTGDIETGWRNNNGQIVFIRTSGVTFNDNAWRHLAVRVSRNGPQVSVGVFCNGTLLKTTSANNYAAATTMVTPLYVFGSRSGPEWSGLLGDFATFDKPLSDSDIARLAQP